MISRGRQLKLKLQKRKAKELKDKQDHTASTALDADNMKCKHCGREYSERKSQIVGQDVTRVNPGGTTGVHAFHIMLTEADEWPCEQCLPQLTL